MIFTFISLVFLLLFVLVLLFTRRSLRPSKQYACGEDLDVSVSSGGFFRVLQTVLSGVFSAIDRLYRGGLTPYLSWVFAVLLFLSALAVLIC